MSGQVTQSVTTDSRLTSSIGFEFRLDDVRSLSDEELQRLFAKMVAKSDFRLVKQGFRAFSAKLLAQGLIEMDDYAAIFGGQAVYQLTVDSDGRFVHAQDGGDAEALAKRYSLAKYGSVDDIQFFADMIIATIGAALDDPSSSWRTMFESARTNGDQVVMMTTGWRMAWGMVPLWGWLNKAYPIKTLSTRSIRTPACMPSGKLIIQSRECDRCQSAAISNGSASPAGAARSRRRARSTTPSPDRRLATASRHTARR